MLHNVLLYTVVDRMDFQCSNSTCNMVLMWHIVAISVGALSSLCIHFAFNKYLLLTLLLFLSAVESWSQLVLSVTVERRVCLVRASYHAMTPHLASMFSSDSYTSYGEHHPSMSMTKEVIKVQSI